MKQQDSRLIDVSARVLMETGKALCVTDDGKRKIWVPKSQVEYDEPSLTLTLPEWLAREKELI